MFQVLHYDTIGSTNDEARRLAATGAPHGTVIHADEQSAGRGRLARGWFSPPGNLYLSIILRIDMPPARLAEISFVAAIAVANAVSTLLPQRARTTVKWPNDVLVDGAKIAGILVEGHDSVTLLGIGLNVLHAPPSAGYPTTTIAASGGIATVDGARDLLLAELQQYLTIWQEEGFAPIRAAWLSRGHAPGAPLRVTLQGRAMDGTFADLDVDGALLMDTPAGRQRIVVGDVSAA